MEGTQVHQHQKCLKKQLLPCHLKEKKQNKTEELEQCFDRMENVSATTDILNWKT